MTNTTQAKVLALPPGAATGPETTKLSALQSLEYRIAIAAQEADNHVFDYTDKGGMTAARSYIAALRKFNGEIDRAHKEAKEVYLRRGQAVDAVKNELKGRVADLIKPHDAAIKAIEEAEQKRIRGHKDRLDELAGLVAAETSQQAKANIQSLELDQRFNPTTFDEFEKEARDLWQRVWSRLTQLHGQLHEQEQKNAELERLQALERQRNQEAEAERLRQEGVAAERQRQEHQREQERQEQARREQEQQQLVQQAEAARVAAEQRAEAEKQRVLRLEQEQRKREQREYETRQAAAASQAHLQAHLLNELNAAMAGMAGPAEVAQAIVAGKLHPAVAVDWASFSPVAWEGA